ncbi:MAG: MaoC family dehydratase [Gammaproteobacteria bacterium]|nr:MaoC family dehydratase [Gammaproteobacteria bacterium]
MTRIFKTIDELRAAAGTTMGPTDWLTIEQSRVDGFADATGDHQWIHVDVERSRQGPFGGTIAHGYLTLSLCSYFLPQLMRVEISGIGINYGLDRVRFPAPVRVGSRIRGKGEIIVVTDVTGGIQTVVRVTIEVEGSDRPACVADTMSRFMVAGVEGRH